MAEGDAGLADRFFVKPHSDGSTCRPLCGQSLLPMMHAGTVAILPFRNVGRSGT
jgi:hypothetical protein